MGGGSNSEKTDDGFSLYFDMVTSGAERTRGILYFFAVALVVIALGTLNGVLRTPSTRLKIVSIAASCLLNSKSRGDDLPDQKWGSNKCGYYYDYVQNFYNIFIDKPENFKSTDETSKLLYAAIVERKASLERVYDDGAYIVIPILNYKVDLNSTVFLQSFMLALLFFILRLSLIAELSALDSLTDLPISDAQSKALVNSHVFVRTTPYNDIYWCFLFLPSIVSLWGLIDDTLAWRPLLTHYLYTDYGNLFLPTEYLCFFGSIALARSCYLLASQLRSKLRALVPQGG